MSRLGLVLNFDLRELIQRFPKHAFWGNILLPIALIVFNLVAFQFGLPSWIHLTVFLGIGILWAIVAMVTIDAFHDLPWWIIFVQFVTIVFYFSSLWKLRQVIAGRRTFKIP